MSELKAEQWLDYAGEPRSCYPKSEADKVIAELEENHKKEVRQLLILNREQANAANRLRDSMEHTIRHQKYKRCLAMAKWCLREYLNCNKYKIRYWLKWRRCWLKLAEKFKEGLVIGVDKGTGTDKTVVLNYKEAK